MKVTPLLLIQYISIILFFIFHFGLSQALVKKKNCIALSLLIATTLSCNYFIYKYFILISIEEANKSFLSLLPTFYLINLFLLRYIFFPLFKKDRTAPTLIYPGVFSIYWDNKSNNYSPLLIEYIMSFLLFTLPWIALYYI